MAYIIKDGEVFISFVVNKKKYNKMKSISIQNDRRIVDTWNKLLELYVEHGENLWNIPNNK